VCLEGESGTARGVIYDENVFSVGGEGPLITNSAHISLNST
jgi:hypothetical protein